MQENMYILPSPEAKKENNWMETCLVYH